jgi:hypothetical protein
MAFYFLLLSILATTVLGWSDKDERMFKQKHTDKQSVAAKQSTGFGPRLEAKIRMVSPEEGTRKTRIPPKDLPIYQRFPVPTKPELALKFDPEASPGAFRKALQNRRKEAQPSAVFTQQKKGRATNEAERNPSNFKEDGKSRRELLQDAVTRQQTKLPRGVPADGGDHRKYTERNLRPADEHQHLQDVRSRQTGHLRVKNNDDLLEQALRDLEKNDGNKRPTGEQTSQRKTRHSALDETYLVESPSEAPTRPEIRPKRQGWGKPANVDEWAVKEHSRLRGRHIG